MKLRLTFIVVSLLLCISSWAHTQIANMRVQHACEPMAVEDQSPLFSWSMNSEQLGVSQKAYRIILRKKHESTVLWDTGKVKDHTSTGIVYSGQPLEAESSYQWILTVWDSKGKKHQAESFFSTGLMNSGIQAWDCLLYTSPSPRD